MKVKKILLCFFLQIKCIMVTSKMVAFCFPEAFKIMVVSLPASLAQQALIRLHTTGECVTLLEASCFTLVLWEILYHCDVTLKLWFKKADEHNQFFTTERIFCFFQLIYCWGNNTFLSVTSLDVITDRKAQRLAYWINATIQNKKIQSKTKFNTKNLTLAAQVFGDGRMGV